jgi:hypothetical protein
LLQLYIFFTYVPSPRNFNVQALVLESAEPGRSVGNVTKSPGAPGVVKGVHGKDAPEPPKSVMFVTPLTPVGAARLKTPDDGHSKIMAYTAPSAGSEDVYQTVVDSFCATVQGTEA